jgi:hypothetical protein
MPNCPVYVGLVTLELKEMAEFVEDFLEFAVPPP